MGKGRMKREVRRGGERGTLKGGGRGEKSRKIGIGSGNVQFLMKPLMDGPFMCEFLSLICVSSASTKMFDAVIFLLPKARR